MPWVDVSSVLFDPDIAGISFTVLRRKQIVGQNGVVSTQVERCAAVGSVVPVGDNSLLREETFQVQAKTIRVCTTFRLRGVAEQANGASYQPDLVLWNGDFFVVRTIDDYTPYGAGMIEAECSSIDYQDEPPALGPDAVGRLDFSLQINSGLIGAA